MFNSSDFTAVKKSASMRMGEFELPLATPLQFQSINLLHRLSQKCTYILKTVKVRGIPIRRYSSSCM